MIRTITFLGLLLVAFLSLNAEIPVTVDPENPPDGGGSGLKAPPMSLTVYIDVERGWNGDSDGFYSNPANWPSQGSFGDKMMSITNIRRK